VVWDQGGEIWDGVNGDSPYPLDGFSPALSIGCWIIMQRRNLDVRQYLPLFSVKTKINKISIIILEERRLIRILSVLKHWKYKRKDCHDSR
jgi:hypothetical protein